ncbi:substrate-binding domain-containing protein [Silvibacterium acidisoli]|uniref:substrate-binding domain-containing protein n=1 Tax=Acidobacteriaceae bacterium ZG23-2 TaxID=2883246 RepID=UPI00406C6805
MRKKSQTPLYLIPILSKALDVLELMENESGSLTLEAIHKRTRFSKTTTYRVLKTLVHRGYLAQLGDGSYRHISRQKKVVFGYGSQSSTMPFSDAVEQSLRTAAVEAGVELLVLDNHYSGTTAVQNADEFAKRGVDLVIEFQTDQAAAPIIADKIASAGIPLIAVDIPHPHATFFGVDNFRCGKAAGEILARCIEERWDGRVDWIIGLDLAFAGPMVQARVTGAFEAINKELPSIKADRYVRIDVQGLRENSHTAMLEFLREHPASRRIAIVASNDASALGAIDAARSLKREKHLMIVGQDAIEEMLNEMRKSRTPAVATISHGAENYGRQLIHVGLEILKGRHVPPYHFAEHKLITQKMMAEED